MNMSIYNSTKSSMFLLFLRLHKEQALECFGLLIKTLPLPSSEASGIVFFLR